MIRFAAGVAPLFEEGAAGAPLGAVEELRVVGRLLRGSIRQLLFLGDTELLVLAGRGVRRFDVERGAWLPSWLEGVDVRRIERLGERLVVETPEGLHLLRPGEALGPLFVELSRQVRWAVGGGRVAVPLEHGVAVYDAEGAEVARLLLGEELISQSRRRVWCHGAALSPDGGQVLTWSGGDIFARWEVESGALCDSQVGFVTHRFAYGPEGEVLQNSGSSLAVRGEGTHGSGGEGLPFERDGMLLLDSLVDDRIVVADELGGFTEWSWSRRERLVEHTGEEKHYDRGPPIRAAASARFVAVHAASYGRLRLYSRGGSGAHRVIGGWSGQLESLSVSADGQRVVAGSIYRNMALVLDREAGTQRELIASQGMVSPFVQPDGSHVFAGTGSNLKARVLHGLPFEGGEVLAGQKLKNWGSAAATRGERYALPMYDKKRVGQVGVYQFGRTRAVATIKFGRDKPNWVVLDPAGERLLIGWQEVASYHEPKSRAPALQTWADHTRGGALGPEGRIALVLFRFDGRKTLLRLQGPKGGVELSLETLERGGWTPVVFSEDGAQVYLGRTDGSLEIRDADDGALLRSLPLHAGAFVGLERVAGQLWSLGEDGSILRLGSP